MEQILNEYHAFLVEKIKIKLDKELENINQLKADFEYLRNKEGVLKYQKYYDETINSEKYAFEKQGYFSEFKSQYALQGIDNEYLKKLESDKKRIIQLIRNDEISKLYFEYFYQAKIKHKDGFKSKNLGSFCAKLTHTFSPEKYCPLDIPIKNYFGLENESFFTAFILISEGYRSWLKENRILLGSLKREAKGLDITNVLFIEKMTDLKFLDFIFWKRANIDAKK
jgi:hypothetical protein